MRDMANAMYYIGCGLAGLVVIAGGFVLHFFTSGVSGTKATDVLIIVAVTAFFAGIFYLIGVGLRFALDPNR